MSTYKESVHSALLVSGRATVDDACEHLARSIFKMKNRYKELETKKKSRVAIVIDEVPTSIHEHKHVDKLCQASTLKGARCSFKAVNGCYCKKHSINGKVVPMGKLLKCK